MLAVVLHSELGSSETFIQAHVNRLATETIFILGDPPRVEGSAASTDSLIQRLQRRVVRELSGSGYSQAYYTAHYSKLFRSNSVTTVLAEYGPTGVRVRRACKRLGIPLVVHFHGYDASKHRVLESNSRTYPALFADASAIVAVSTSMAEKLISLGANPDKLHCIPCGVDLRQFPSAAPIMGDVKFLAAGRLVDKKGPHLTILAFQQVLALVPHATLDIIGDGPLMGVCKDLVSALNLQNSVTLQGTKSHDDVLAAMQQSYAFVQHSVTASSGDSEGTPVAVMEAGAAGLPIVATRHAGITDVVEEGISGYLVAERDIDAMADRMCRLAVDKTAARTMGTNARSIIADRFNMDKSIEQLRRVIDATKL